MLDDLTMDQDIQEDKDTIGGKFDAVESGVYKLKIKSAYAALSAGGAKGLYLELETATGKTINTVFWMTSGTAKGCKNYYIDKAGKKQYLPGFNQANALCLLTVGKPISAIVTAEKIVDVYDGAVKARIPTKVDMLVELLEQPITAGIIKQLVNKNIKDDTGKYVPTAATRVENEIDKLFRTKDNLTVTEIKANMTESSFIHKWHTKWNEVTRDRTVKVAESFSAPGAAAPKTKTLFA